MQFCSPTFRILFACLVSVKKIPLLTLQNLFNVALQNTYPVFHPCHILSALSTSSLILLSSVDYTSISAYVFKICNGHVALDKNDFFSFNPLSRIRGHCFKVTVPNSRINVRQHFFAVRVIPAWNYLPTTLVTSSSVCLFKKRVSEIDLSSFLTIKL